MCGRYYIPDEDMAAELRNILAQANRGPVGGSGVKTGEIAPTDTAPVLANSRSLAVTAFAMKWGYTTADGSLVFNARSESAGQKPLFRDGMARRRCLVPAAHYFEWEKAGRQRIRYAIRPAGARMLYMAGIYRFEGSVPVFSILTREPADSIAFIHNRMPVILPGDMIRDWLDPRCPADELLRHAVLDLSFAPTEPVQERFI